MYATEYGILIKNKIENSDYKTTCYNVKTEEKKS